MEEHRKRTPKKPEHPVREWISDNLRYFMLFGGILVILLIAGLVIKLLSGSANDTSTASETKAESVVKTDSEEEASNKDHMEGATVTPTPTAEADADADEKVQDAENDMTMEADSSMITSLIKTYFGGLATRNPVLVSSCVDTFTEEDSKQVLENTQITSYSNVEVYTCDGIDDKSRVAFVSYCYTVDGSEAEIPALTQFYVYDTGNEDWKLASDTSDAAVTNKIQELVQSEPVQEMITKVQQQYDQVMAEHPELQ